MTSFYDLLRIGELWWIELESDLSIVPVTVCGHDAIAKEIFVRHPDGNVRRHHYVGLHPTQSIAASWLRDYIARELPILDLLRERYRVKLAEMPAPVEDYGTEYPTPVVIGCLPV